MKCKILFSGKSKENIIKLSSAEFAQRAVNVNSIDALSSPPSTTQSIHNFFAFQFNSVTSDQFLKG